MPSEYTGLGISCVVYLWDFQPAGRKSGICTGRKICLLFGAVLTISYLIDFTIHFIQNIQNSESFKNMDILSRIIRH